MTKSRIIFITLASLVIIIFTVLGIVGANYAKQPSTKTTYDPFTQQNVPVTNDGEPPVIGDPTSFEFVNAADLNSYFNNDVIFFIRKSFGSYVILTVNKSIYRAKLVDGSLHVPGDGTITFKLVLDTTNSGTYTVRIKQVPQQVEFESFTITNPQGGVFTVPPSGATN